MWCEHLRFIYRTTDGTVNTLKDARKESAMTEDKDMVTIIVNGREKGISTSTLSPDGELSFDQVVKLAYESPPSGPDIVFTMSYRNGAGRPPEGRLVAGQSVKIQDGTVFNVSFTDRS